MESLISSDCFLCRSQLFPYNSQAVQSRGAIPRSSFFYCCSPPPWKFLCSFMYIRVLGFFKLENLTPASRGCGRVRHYLLAWTWLFLCSASSMPDVPHLNSFLRFLSIILVCTVLCGGCKPNPNLTNFFLLAFLGIHTSLPSETVRNEAISVPRDCSLIKYLFTHIQILLF